MYFYFCVIGIFSTGYLNAADVGEGCSVARSGAPGTCKLIDDCPVVINEITKQSLFPTSCGFLGHRQIVCCPNPATTTTTPKPTGPLRISQRSK